MSRQNVKVGHKIHDIWSWSPLQHYLAAHCRCWTICRDVDRIATKAGVCRLWVSEVCDDVERCDHMILISDHSPSRGDQIHHLLHHVREDTTGSSCDLIEIDEHRNKI